MFASVDRGTGCQLVAGGGCSRQRQSGRGGRRSRGQMARALEHCVRLINWRLVLQATDAQKQQKAEQGDPQVITAKDGTQLLEQRARPGSSSAQAAATGEVR